MNVGILSDTHNHAKAARVALDILMAQGAEHLVHCGDVGEAVMEMLAAVCRERGIRAHAATGNCDGGAWFPPPPGVETGEALMFELDGKTCGVMHGHDSRRLEVWAASGRFDYIFTGHTHVPAEERAGETRIINPGSPARPRNGLATVAMLDTATGRVTWTACE